MKKAGNFIFGQNDDKLEEVLVNLLAEHNIKISILEAGIDDVVSSKIKSVENGVKVLSETLQYSHPHELQSENEIPLRDLAVAKAQELAESVDASIVILSLPDVEENADIDYATTVAISVGGNIKSRVYGFGGKSDLARGWVSQWTMAYVWQQLREQFNGMG
jgi:hypothetical protein